MDGKPVAGKDGQSRLYASALRDGDGIIVKMTNLSKFSQEVTLRFPVTTDINMEKWDDNGTSMIKTRIGGRTFSVYKFKLK